jgi:diguanylate cyclase (GGDEF)-like protein
MWQILQRMGRWQGEIWNRRKNGEVFPEWLSIVAIKDNKGNTRQYMAVFSDITKRKQDEVKIWRQANYDALTELPNRNLFKDRLDQAMHAAHREGWQLALMFIDLDRFKWVNDTLGHGAGDLLLQQTATRLSACVREMDTVARLGGDEFTVILSDIGDSDDIARIADKVIATLGAPFDLDGHEAFVSGSVGIALYPQDADNMEALLRCADSAMYSAKAAGRNTYHFYTGEMNEASQRRLQMEADLRRVLERNELSLYYQPILHRDGTIAGAEALLRWQHPEFGMVPPDEFIPLAEEIGVIVEIDQWVMRRACFDTQSWKPLIAPDFFISVNVSSKQCKSDVCRRSLHAILIESCLPASQLKLEITERVLIENTEYVIGLLNEVKAMGIRLAIDDFGTGYSSLSYLKQFPVDVLKIDRTFVAGLPEDKDDVALVEAIMAMGHSLNLQVVAEGVETAEQLEFLRALGCDMIQGFYYSRALPKHEFMAYLKQYQME